MEWITIAMAIIEILKYLDSQKDKKTKKVTAKQVVELSKVSKKTQKAVSKVEAAGGLPNLVWVVNWLLRIGQKK